MIVNISQEQDNQLTICDGNGKLLETLNLKDNLQRALQLLRQLNSIQTIDGTPVYKTRMFNGISVWSFHQHVIFWNYLVPYVRHEDTLRFLVDKKVGKVTLDSDIEGLAQYLRVNGIEVVSNSARSPAKLSSFLQRVNRVIGLKLTLLAFLKLLIRRPALLIYTPDRFSQKHGCDFRFFAVYAYPKERKIPFVEVFHTLLGQEFIGNIAKRRRLALYLECLPLFSNKNEVKCSEYDLSTIDSHNRRYFLYLLKLIDQYSQRSIRRIKILARILRLAKIEALLSIDDVRYTNELIVACRLNGIKTYGFQHGQFTKYHVGWMNYDIPKELSVTFDNLFIWNEYWKRALLAYSNQYDDSNAQIGGVLRELEHIKYGKKGGNIEKPADLNILLPYETFAPKAEVGEYVDQFIEQGIQIYFKVRPDISYESQFAQYHIKHKDRIKIVDNIDDTVLSEIDAVAGTYSTFLNEMLFYEKPVLLLETSFDLGHQLVDDGLVLVVDRNADASRLLDYINNYKSKKAQAWPVAGIKLKETLDKIVQR